MFSALMVLVSSMVSLERFSPRRAGLRFPFARARVDSSMPLGFRSTKTFSVQSLASVRRGIIERLESSRAA
jgi:hypothetical protein